MWRLSEPLGAWAEAGGPMLTLLEFGHDDSAAEQSARCAGERSRMAIEGNLEVFQLPEILQMIAAQRKTGILTVQGESDIVAVSFKDGQVVAADALNQTVEEGLGQVLASQGLVNPRDFAAVSAEHEAGGRRLLDLLLEHGHVHRAQLLDALRLQTYRLLLQLLRWEQGDFKFYSGEEVAFEDGFYAISVEELLMRSLSDLGDDGNQGPPPDLDAAYEVMPGSQPIRYVADGRADPDRSGVWLAPEDRPLVERLDGSKSARELAASTGLGEYRVLFTLYRLLRGGVVRSVTRHAPPIPGVRPPLAVVSPVPGSVVPAPAVRDGASAAAPAAARPAPAPPRASPPPGAVPARPGVEDQLPDAPEPPVAEARPSRPRALPQERLRGAAVWVPRVLAATVAAVLLALPWLAPRRLLLPFPAQGSARASLERDQRAARHLQLDRAARTYFLLEGHYPDRLDDMPPGLLPADGSLDPAGHPLAYSSDERSYQVVPVIDGRPVAELGAREAITGDFLLDPEFLRHPEGADIAPLVLLD